MEVFLCDPEIWKPCKVTLGNRRRSFPLAWLVGQDIPILDFYKAHCVHGQWLSHVQLFATTWIVARQAPLSIRFSRQEYWSGLPFPSPGDLPDPGIEPVSLASPAWAGVFFTSEPPGKPRKLHLHHSNPGNNQSKITYFLHVLYRNVLFLPIFYLSALF